MNEVDDNVGIVHSKQHQHQQYQKQFARPNYNSITSSIASQLIDSTNAGPPFSTITTTATPATTATKTTTTTGPQMKQSTETSSGSIVVSRENKMSNILFNSDLNDDDQRNLSSYLYDTNDGRGLNPMIMINTNSITGDISPSLSSSSSSSSAWDDIDDETLMTYMKNNHQTSTTPSETTSPSASMSPMEKGATSYNSRHYQFGQTGPSYYGKYNHYNTNNNHNYNLNYIHSLLTKPNSQHNQHHHYHQVGLGSSNPLASPMSNQQQQSSPLSSLTNAINGLQLTLAAHKHHHLSPPPTSLASISVAGREQDQYQQQQQQTQLSAANSTTTQTTVAIGDFPDSNICGRQQVLNNHREPRIVGGNNTYEGEFPWAVSIQRHGNHHCGGVIVGRRWVLTAAHCVRSQSVGNLIVRTGGNTLSRSANSVNSHFEHDYLVERIVMHDDFSRYDNLTASQMKSSANTNNADIALLRLKHEIHLNELAWPVCFPNKEAGNFSGHDAIVIGWGKLNEKSEDFSNELQKVKLTIIDNKVCQNWFRQAGREMPIDDRIICAGFKSGGKDACHGDSGGPLLSRINGQYAVVGVVSTGIGCARPLLPGLYSRVSSYISWIEKYVNNYS